MKGKDMILSDFLLRQTHNDWDLHGIIPISFNMHKTIYKNYYKTETKERYLVQTWLQTKSSGVTFPKVHGAKKILDTNILPEKQKIVLQIKRIVENKLRLGQGRAGIRCKKPQPVDGITASTSKSCKIPRIPTTQDVAKNRMDFPVQESITNKTGAIMKGTIQDKNRELPFQPDPIYRPSPRPPENLLPQSKPDTRPKIDIEFKENSPYQEGIISEAYQRPDKSYFQKLKELESLVNTGKLVQKCLPKQADIDKILKIIKCKVLKGTHLSITIKDIQAGYLISSYFKDIYLYLAHNKLPSTKSAICKVKALAEKYMLLDLLLFKIISTPDKETAVLAVLGTCIDKIITLHHLSLFTGHQGVIKTYLTISNKLLIPNLIHYLRSYTKGCHICQLMCNEKLPTRQLQTRINLNYRPLTRLSMALKVMPQSSKGHKFICE